MKIWIFVFSLKYNWLYRWLAGWYTHGRWDGGGVDGRSTDGGRRVDGRTNNRRKDGRTDGRRDEFCMKISKFEFSYFHENIADSLWCLASPGRRDGRRDGCGRVGWRTEEQRTDGRNLKICIFVFSWKHSRFTLTGWLAGWLKVLVLESG